MKNLSRQSFLIYYKQDISHTKFIEIVTSLNTAAILSSPPDSQERIELSIETSEEESYAKSKWTKLFLLFCAISFVSWMDQNCHASLRYPAKTQQLRSAPFFMSVSLLMSSTWQLVGKRDMKNLSRQSFLFWYNLKLLPHKRIEIIIFLRCTAILCFACQKWLFSLLPLLIEGPIETTEEVSFQKSE